MYFRYIFIGIIAIYISGTLVVHGQINAISIVSTYTVEDEVYKNDDIISLDQNLNEYTLSRITGDENLFGVIQINPTVVFRSGEGDIPIAKLGEVFVNVTGLNGPIQVGDQITSSEIPGKGQRFDIENGRAIGTALQSFNPVNSTSTILYEGNDIAVGTILVLLNLVSNSIGPFQGPAPSIIINEDIQEGTSVGTIIRYFLALLFAVVSLYLIFKKLGPNLKQGIISVGRNPLAKPTIQKMMTFNIALILVISLGVLLITLAIILLPV